MSLRLISGWVAIVLVAVAGLGFLGAPSTADARNPFVIDEDQLPFDALPGATAYSGVWQGAGFRIEIPDNWNGDLVLYAHGYRGEGPNLTVSNPRIRQHLIDNGYAWAASSYRANGYVPGVGAEDTRNLLSYFEGRFGQADRVYMTGHSMGGHVTGVVIEQWPHRFAGALPMCGVMGDNELFDYFQDVYLVAETIVGNEPAIPTPDGYFPPLATLGQMGPAYPASLNSTGQNFKNAIENLTGGERPIFDEGWLGGVGGVFIFTVAGTGQGRSNLDTVYQFDSNPALTAEEQAFNDAIVRIGPGAETRRPPLFVPGRQSLPASPRINGELAMPVISIHTIGELFVPFHMEQVYAQRARANGNADMLVTRAIRDTNHCGFALQEEINAFDDLVNWVVNGTKPDGDAILNPNAVANSQFGCAHTTVDRAGLPPCEISSPFQANEIEVPANPPVVPGAGSARDGEPERTGGRADDVR